MITEYYNSADEKKLLVSNYLKTNHTLIHDTFINENNNKTDGKSGQLIFDVIPENTEQTQKIEIEKTLLSKLKDNTITFEEVKSLLKIKFNVS